ncbi:myotubularin-related protein 12 isoform X3 [Carcharodon carcharias]|uniref:myotubularin-related protein 12 isoform X3 n=1 Tax=Carcharodon carcharias TaxID=13397 RepID=UPI001B7F776E|nr:myotubularin-related protein 12 isoform X3 [Carcharodon carcharias]
MLSLGSGGGKTAKPSFVSYVSPEEIKKENVNDDLKPHLLPGELVICEANTVVKYSREDSLQRGFYGKLVCTNFKISFLSAEQLLDEVEQSYKNKLMGENDISLHCVDQIFGVYDDKKKPLLPGAVKNKIPEKLLLYCKDFRVFHFGLRYTKEEDARRLIRGIVHHCLNPTSLKCLFAFSYVGAAGGLKVGPVGIEEEPPTIMFETKNDWKVELDRTGGLLTYRIISSNENYKISTRLPQFFAVPSTVADDDIKKYKGKGIPLWCWSHSSGCALLKMAALPEIADDSTSQMDKSWIDRLPQLLGENHPLDHTIRTEILSATLPTLQEIQASYNRFKQLFLPEENCSDLCCLIASLVQVIIDPHFRTLSGFQSLIQKEWVMGCHCFLDRCNLLRSNDKEAPVFLLFLECVWQLLQQYPPAFEFTETYVTILSDSMFIPIFSTFLFNSPWQRDNNQMLDEDRRMVSRSLKLPSVWEWSVQFENSVQALFYNPLYIGKPKMDNRRTQRVKDPALNCLEIVQENFLDIPEPQRQMSLPSSPSYHSRPSPRKGFFREETDHLIKTFLGKKISRWTLTAEDHSVGYKLFYENWRSKPIDHHGLLLPLHDGPALRIWGQRYLRWIPEVQIPGGGSITALNKACEIIDEIKTLQTKVSQRILKRQPSSPNIDIFTPFHESSRLSSTFPFGTLRRQSIKPRIPVSTNLSMSFGSMENLPDDEEDLVHWKNNNFAWKHSNLHEQHLPFGELSMYLDKLKYEEFLVAISSIFQLNPLNMHSLSLYKCK